MTSEEIKKIVEKCQVGVKSGRHSRPFETEVVLPEIPLFDRMEIANALYSYADMVERCEEQLEEMREYIRKFDPGSNSDHISGIIELINYILKGKDNANG